MFGIWIKWLHFLAGDVVTPGFFQDYLNAENILWRPYGGGEMITFNFAYNILTLRFMKASQQLSDERLLRTLAEMNIGKHWDHPDMCMHTTSSELSR